jgi:ABC-type amino acid transport substrate-binding protein
VKIVSAAIVAAGLLMSGMQSSLAADTNATPGGASPSGPPLRVGIAPDYQPLAFRQPDGLAGLEVDFAKALGQALGRPVEFEVLDRGLLIDVLLEKKIDIIMSGMSITSARQLRVGFCDPYVTNQLRAIFAFKSADRFKTSADVLNSTGRIGVISGTSAETFVKKNCPNGKITGFTSRQDIPFYLTKGGRMDLFIDDTFALAPMYAKNEAELAYLPEPLSEDYLAWAVRPDDTQLRSQLNGFLIQWKDDGTLDKMLNRWLPYLKNLKPKQAAATPQ